MRVGLNKLAGSLASAERSPGFQVVVDIAGLGSGVERHVLSLAGSASDLDVNFLLLFNRERLTLFSVELLCFGLYSSTHILCFDQGFLGFEGVVEVSQHLVPLRVEVDLNGVLVVGEQRVMTVR